MKGRILKSNQYLVTSLDIGDIFSFTEHGPKYLFCGWDLSATDTHITIKYRKHLDDRWHVNDYRTKFVQRLKYIFIHS
jgi:hypothetical protein